MKKETISVQSNVPAKIKTACYACGPACDAFAYCISINDVFYLPSKQLAGSFYIVDLPVIVTFKKTGRYPEQRKGPSGVEIIDLVGIRKQ